MTDPLRWTTRTSLAWTADNKPIIMMGLASGSSPAGRLELTPEEAHGLIIHLRQLLCAAGSRYEMTEETT